MFYLIITMIMSVFMGSTSFLLAHAIENESKLKDILYKEGSNVLLRPIQKGDEKGLAPIFGDETSMKYYGQEKIYSKDDIKKIVEKNVLNNQNPDREHYTFTILTDAGVSGLLTVWYPHRKENAFEIGYVIDPHLSGLGIATEAARLVIDAIDNPYIKIIATVHPENKGSQKVLEKLGFKRDLSRQGVTAPKTGKIRDYYIYVPKKENSIKSSL